MWDISKVNKEHIPFQIHINFANPPEAYKFQFEVL